MDPLSSPPRSSPSMKKSSGLNLPAGMSGRSLRLDTRSSTCSDRFIPCRSSSRLDTFGLVEKASPAKEGGNEAYTRLLKCELFGADFVGSPNYSPAANNNNNSSSPMSSPSKNMLRFKTQHSGSSPFSPSVLDRDSVSFSGEALTPPKPPRKVPKTPHKVCHFSLFLYLL